MPTVDYIKRSDALQTVEDYFREKKSSSLFMAVETMCLCLIHKTPAADVEPVRHGHWIMYAYDEAICSECDYDRGTEFESTKEAKERWDELPMWCEGCGAKMDGEETGDDEE